jgi:ABC-2 type transport system permease protein
VRFIQGLKKELLLLLRDPAGLGILFILPGIMVFLIAFIQDSAFDNFTETKMPLVIANEDQDSLGTKIIRGFTASGVFEVITQIDGKPANETNTFNKVSNGSYQIGVIVPKGATEKIRTRANNILDEAFGTGDTKIAIEDTSIRVTLLYDPALLSSFRASVNANLDKYITQIQTTVLVDAFSEKLQKLVPNMQPISMENGTGMEIREKFARTPDNSIEPNAVQHNVPAWTIFAMFFIVIPLATNMVREKDNGIETRLRTIPGSYFYSIVGKMSAYQIVCIFQFCFMILVGIFAMPLLGLPKLEIGTNTVELIITAGLTALAATAFGILVGTIAGTHDQAASFGAISVLIMAAIGGIWVPVFLMPPTIKAIGSFSPLNWSLSAFYDIFLRNATFKSLWPNWAKLIIFTLVLAGISILIKKLKRTL